MTNNPTGLSTGIITQQTASQDALPTQTTSQQTILPNLGKPLNPQQAAALQQNILQGTVRKINVNNMITVFPQTDTDFTYNNSNKQQTQPQHRPRLNQVQIENHETKKSRADFRNLRAQSPHLVSVTMSALANQLSSPPAVMSSSTINPQTYNFAQLKPGTQQPQQIIITNNSVGNTANRLIAQANVRRESLPVPSPGSDSNASNASSTNMGSNASTFSIGHNFNTFIATSPTGSILSDNGVTLSGSHNNQSATTLIERLNNTNNSIISQQSINSPLGSAASPQTSSSNHFMAPSPKSSGNITITQQQPHNITISPLPSPATSINFSLQSAMATFPGLQNVQVSKL